MAQYELSSTLARYLDRHLVLPLCEFLQVRLASSMGVQAPHA
jgi:eIF3 subunit 6 N terminal domain